MSRASVPMLRLRDALRRNENICRKQEVRCDSDRCHRRDVPEQRRLRPAGGV